MSKITYKYIFFAQVSIFIITTIVLICNGGVFEFLGTTGAFIYFFMMFGLFGSLLISRWFEIKFCCSRDDEEEKIETIEEVCIVNEKSEGLIINQQDQLMKLAHDLC